MESANRQFIAKPYFFKRDNASKSEIEYTDVLTYVTIRSFYNSTNFQCFPGLQTIANKARASKKFIIKSLERLEKANYITALRSRKMLVSNRYLFQKFKSFDRIPLEIFEHEELSLYERSMLLCLRELAITPTDLIGSITELSKQLDVSYKTLYTQFNSLSEKGFISSQGKKFHRLEVIDWNFNRAKHSLEDKIEASFVIA